MYNFNILLNSNISREEMSKLLFPERKFPLLAFNRLIKGESQLSVIQLDLIKSILTTSEFEEFTYKNVQWTFNTRFPYHIFTKGNIKAKLCIEDFRLIILRGEENIVDTVLFKSHITILEFFQMLDDYIINS